MDHLNCAGRGLTLARPGKASPSLRAWDAADEQLIDTARARLAPGDTLAVVDDAFGALTLGLADFRPVSVADSAGLMSGLALNSESNGLAQPPVTSWRSPPDGPFRLVVMRIPRQLDYLDYLLRWANEVLAPDGLLLAAGMIKHIPDRSAELFGQRVHTEQVHPARKKARLIECRPGRATLADWDRLWQGYPMPGSDQLLKALPAVFSRERLDPGAARHQGDVLDLACGNGVLGLTALHANPSLQVTFVDISSQAMISVERALAGFADPVLRHHDGVPADAGLFDLILLNPPYHEGGAVGDHIALRLFAQARGHLRPGGTLLVVGNRHLGYHRSLRRHFASVRQVDADPRFVVFEAG